MKVLREGVLLGGVCLISMLALAPSAAAHGGQYIGPQDVVPGVPGGPGGSGRPSVPTTGGPSGPGVGGPSGPVTPGGNGPTSGGPSGPSGGSMPSGPRSGPRTMEIGDDLTRWVYWWEFNKNPYIRLKTAVHASATITGTDDFYLGIGQKHGAIDTLAPTRDQIAGEVLPALKRALDGTLERDFDIISSCLIALAKIGQDQADLQLVEVFRARLAAGNQEIRETAALALGLAGTTDRSREQLDLLVGLALDQKLGRSASAQSEVNERTRSFAAYGLGLLAHSTASLAIKREVFAALQHLVTDEAASGRNLRVAAIHGISLLNIGTGTADERQLLDAALDCLEDYYRQDLGVGSQLLQAHCPTAIAKLMPRNHPRAAAFKQLFVEGLAGRLGKSRRSDRDLQRSCALALGRLCTPDDVACSASLLASYHDAKDAQTRYFSVLALGQIGGDGNRETLLKLFDKARTLDKPWCALALGVQAFADYEAKATLDTMVGTTLFDEFKSSKNPEVRGAIAIALGLARHQAAADELRQVMVADVAQQELAGYLCVGLALMNDTASRDEIRQVVLNSARRPELLQQAAIALGKLGDKRAADDLRAMLQTSDANLAKLAAISSALGFIGDRSSVAPLCRMLLDDSQSQLPRAFAAVALGGVADKESMPWNSKIGVDTNYRASTETLTNRGTGILDIL